MNDGEIRILKGQEVSSLLEGRERELMEQVAHAYQSHAGGESSLPHSTC
jgi:hypothetical protein